MTGEQPIEQPEHEGERYLKLLGLEDFADKEIPTDSGTIQARDFLEICGQHARPILLGFEAMDPEDPRYETTKNLLRTMIGRYVQGDSPSQ